MPLARGGRWSGAPPALRPLPPTAATATIESSTPARTSASAAAPAAATSVGWCIAIGPRAADAATARAALSQAAPKFRTGPAGAAHAQATFGAELGPRAGAGIGIRARPPSDAAAWSARVAHPLCATSTTVASNGTGCRIKVPPVVARSAAGALSARARLTERTAAAKAAAGDTSWDKAAAAKLAGGWGAGGGRMASSGTQRTLVPLDEAG